MPAFQDADRIRKPLRITLDPEWKERAETMAAAAGLPLSRWIEQLIRAEYARCDEKPARTEKKRRNP